MYKGVLFLKTTLSVIREEVKRAGRRETGGALVGYLSSDNILVVTHASGPGPRAELKSSSVLIDGRHTQEFCTRIFALSGGRLDYIGDWHRHPGRSLAASEQDREAMLTIANSKCCSVPFPLSAIYRSYPERTVAFALEHGTLRRVRMKWIDKTGE